MSKHTTAIRFFVLVLLTLSVAVVWHAVFAAEREILTVAFLDVGQGDAVYIESPTGSQVLVDGGPGKTTLRALGGVMPFYDRTLDVIVATHPDQDHIGGLPDILERYEVSLVLEPGASSDTGTYEAFEERVGDENTQHLLARRGQVLNLGGGAYLRILFPDRDVSGLETNAASVVAQLVYGDTEVLLTGDSPQQIEKYLANIEHEFLESDIVKVGHHGSKTSSAEAFIGWTSARYAIVSAGKDNRYGHPHEDVVQRFRDFGATIVSTAESGTIIFTSDGMHLTLVGGE